VGITFFDILILLALFGGAVLGFYRGLFRQAAMTLIIYISTVIAALSYRSLGRTLGQITGQTSGATDVLAFLLVMGIMVLLLALISRDLLGHIDVDRMGIWVNIGGMIFGFVNAAIVVAVLLIVIRSATSGGEWVGYSNVQAFLRRQVTRSWMAYALGPFMRLMLALIQPWLFGHSLPPLLSDAV
jgi:uncharacterized membrane protein required for colicin V production